MENYSEKREYKRYDYDSQVYLYKYDSQDQYYEGNMYNYSCGGMYLKSNEKMEIGEQVNVKIKNYNPDSSGLEKYKNYAGYVKWSSDLGTSSPGGQYGYGVEYAEPVYY